MTTFSRSSRERLTAHDLGRFPSESLFDRLARSVCEAGCLPRRELFEAWEVARRVRRLFRGGRIVDLAAGHGLMAQAMLLLDDSSPLAIGVDTAIPPSSATLHRSLVATWPRLADRVEFRVADIDTIALSSSDIVVSSHACGALTDVILNRATSAGARVAVLPCCQDHSVSDTGGLTGWLDGSLAVDIVRAQRLRERGYKVWTQIIPTDITQKNRLLLGAPNDGQDFLATYRRFRPS
jgi:Methyltransferase domain